MCEAIERSLRWLWIVEFIEVSGWLLQAKSILLTDLNEVTPPEVERKGEVVMKEREQEEGERDSHAIHGITIIILSVAERGGGGRAMASSVTTK
jgi:hypothetical protein